ncbi:hypothetical protein PILCRDRAFT_829269 [Piloderma croceum F 1598]|uniref:Uncharacterized protein n=1 Tax=Piloderma croceum (strain F 1598) TaxID=765440 RepID=A0A0C3AHN2_PILCF|nr:hypothetical protein PILCRDRAFT_829269 [Piloderma croceum F 1598]
MPRRHCRLRRTILVHKALTTAHVPVKPSGNELKSTSGRLYCPRDVWYEEHNP